MAFGVFIHRTDSIYDDVPSQQYQFPKQYLSRALNCIGDWVIYLEPSKVKQTKGYFAIAKIQEIIPDPKQQDMYLAIIERGSYLDFGDHVPFRDAGNILELGLLNDEGKVSGRAQAAVRSISPSDFERIIDRGLIRENDILPRDTDSATVDGFAEAQIPFEDQRPRNRVEQLTNRVIRDRNFRRTILRAYGERCAITGLRLINGGGRAEVEAAHIRPVEHDGPDIVSNGIALSGTAHWMFDRGLVGLDDEMQIIVSRQANDASAVRSMINPTGTLIVPKVLSERPHRRFVKWHRENCFKH
jgi:putative restriction endonuclease